MTTYTTNNHAPAWADLIAQHGALPHTDGPGVPPWGSLHQDIGHEPTPQRSTLVLVAVLIGLTLGVLFATGVLIQRNNLLPASVPLIGKDSGVAACETMAAGNSPTGEQGSKVWTERDYRAARSVFADSRYPAIRDNGTRMIDLSWQINGMGKDDLGMLAFIGPLTDAYAGLTGGCAEQGYTIPALGGN